MIKLPVLLLVLATTGTFLRADAVIQPNDVLAICGDSITEQKVYSVDMEDYLLMCQPTAGQRIAQFGWSGEQAPGFLARLDSDIFPFKPTVATTCYGMNDGHYGALTDAVSTPYRTSQTAIVEAMKKNGVRVIILGSAKCVDSTAYKHTPPAEVYNKTLGALAEIDKDIAAKEGVIYADVYGITTATMEKAKAKLGQDYVFAGNDGVHPGQNGQLVMAYAFLKALGCDGAIGTITVDLAGGTATGSDGHKILSCQNGSVDIESTRYPFCLTGSFDKPDPGTTANITNFFPFNQDLNRYMLVVKGLKTAKARVTWGKDSKEFTAAELEKGVNLTANFVDNPFSAAFAKVNAAVQAQQAFETLLVKQYMHSVGQFKTALPEESAAFDSITAAGLEKQKKLYEASVAAVQPVQHTIKIEPVAGK
jgi:lysophospholipase L1-like esterase